MKLKLDDKVIIVIVSILFMIFFLVLFRVTGFRVAAGLILFFLLPVYLILDNFNFSLDEKLVLSFFLSIGVTPTLVYYLGLLISFRFAMFIVFVVLVLIGVLIKRDKKKR